MSLDAVLMRELEQVLGEYRPGSTPIVYRQSGEQSHYVAVHEHSHRDLANNTAYGWTLQFLIEGRLTPDPHQQRQLARALMGRAWHVFEGHACWMELWNVKRDSGLAAANAWYAKLPPDYQRATTRFLDPTFLEMPLAVETALAIVFALAEFAMDQAVAILPAQPENILMLAQSLRDAPSDPDRLIEVWSPRLLSLVAAEGSVLLARMRPNVLGEDRSPAALQSYLAAIRGNVQAVKDELLSLDQTLTPAGRALHTTSGMMAFVRALNPAIPTAAPRPEGLISVDTPTRVKNRADTPIAVPPQQVTLDALKSTLMTRIFGQDGRVAICWGHLPGAMDPVKAKVPAAMAAQIEAQLIESGAVRSTAAGPEFLVDVTVMRCRFDAEPDARGLHLEDWEHFLSHVPREQCIEFWRWIAERGRGQCAWLALAPRIHGELVCPDYGAIAMPVLFGLSEHGAETFKEIRRLVPAVDYCWRMQLSDGFHAVAVGSGAGPGFFALAPGQVGASEHYCRSFGFEQGDVEPPAELQLLILGTVARYARSVSP